MSSPNTTRTSTQRSSQVEKNLTHMDRIPFIRSTVRKNRSQPPGTGSGSQPAWQPKADAMDVDYDPFNEPDPDAIPDSAVAEPAQPEDDGSLPDAGPMGVTTDPDALTGSSLTTLTESLPPTQPRRRRNAPPAAAPLLMGQALEDELARRLEAARKKKYGDSPSYEQEERPAKLSKHSEASTAAPPDPATIERSVSAAPPDPASIERSISAAPGTRTEIQKRPRIAPRALMEEEMAAIEEARTHERVLLCAVLFHNHSVLQQAQDNSTPEKRRLFALTRGERKVIEKTRKRDARGMVWRQVTDDEWNSIQSQRNKQ